MFRVEERRAADYAKHVHAMITSGGMLAHPLSRMANATESTRRKPLDVGVHGNTVVIGGISPRDLDSARTEVDNMGGYHDVLHTITTHQDTYQGRTVHSVSVAFFRKIIARTKR